MDLFLIFKMAEPITIGTVALDSIETPFGKVENALGGNACYASIAKGFSIERLRSIKDEDIERRYKEFRAIREF